MTDLVGVDIGSAASCSLSIVVFAVFYGVLTSTALLGMDAVDVVPQL